MRALQHLKKRFEFALISKKPIYPNQNDLEAINQLIEFVNGKTKNEHLEDALMLFYILQHWKVENVENSRLKMSENRFGVFKLTGPEILLKKLSMFVNPKPNVILEIRDELRLHQTMNGVPKDQRVKTETVAELLNEVLKIAKTDFPIIKDLDKCEVVYNHRNTKKNAGVTKN